MLPGGYGRDGSYFSLFRQRKGKQKKCWFLRRVSACRPRFRIPFSACWPSYFLLLCQKKVTKEKASQRPCPFGVPCATRTARGRAQTRYAQTSARPDPCAAALLSTAYGSGGPRVLVRCAHIAHACWRAACAVVAAATFGITSKTTTVPTAAAAPSPHPLTTTASFANLGQQTRPAALRFKILIPNAINQIGCSSSPSPRRG